MEIVQIDKEVLVKLIEKIDELIKEKESHSPEEELLSTAEVSKLLKIKDRTLCIYREKFQIPHLKMGRKYLYKISDLKQFIDFNKK